MQKLGGILDPNFASLAEARWIGKTFCECFLLILYVLHFIVRTSPQFAGIGPIPEFGMGRPWVGSRDLVEEKQTTIHLTALTSWKVAGLPAAKIDVILVSRLLAISGQTALTRKSYPLTTSWLDELKNTNVDNEKGKQIMFSHRSSSLNFDHQKSN